LAGPALAQGHGGPVRALDVATTGDVAVSGSFDASAIVWRLTDGSAAEVLRFHAGGVNAVAALPDGGIAAAGTDGRIALWRRGATAPARVLEGHPTAPVAALATDGERIASASWNGTARVWGMDGSVRVLTGHEGNVNGVAFAQGGVVVTAGYDATVRIWPTAGEPRIIRLPAPLNALAVARDGEIAVAGADGLLRFVALSGVVEAEIEVDSASLTALAMSHDGRLVAAAGLSGAAMVLDRAARRIVTVLHTGEHPLWALAFTPDGASVLTGGAAGVVRQWELASGRPIRRFGPAPIEEAALPQDRGAEIFRACAVCHTLAADGGNRAGPTLHALFGRHIASVPGYAYSDALRRLDLVWTEATVARLFEIGPAAFLPGTKMPEQVLANPDDRVALVHFLKQATQ
jgi:cytochrome c